MTPAHLSIWAICAIATGCTIARPFRLPEATWAVAGAVVLIALGLLPVADAIGAVAKGSDVYLFLLGMMLLSEMARREGLFDWIATLAVNAARRSSTRLFAMIYLVGTVVAVFLSNDATAVVLTPAVLAATKKAKVDPLPFLFICALVANAASFVLPISNPANLVLYGNHLPALEIWLTRFAVPSLVSILATYGVLRFVERNALSKPCESDLEHAPLSKGGSVALCGIGLTGAVLLTISALNVPLGLPTAALGVLTLVVVLALKRSSPMPVVKDVSWSILPLVAGLFVMVEALARTGLITNLADLLRTGSGFSETRMAATAGATIAFACNVINNLPAGLIARSALDIAHTSQRITDALLIGVDLGPNLSVTGSLATILWLTAIRREGQDVGFFQFLKIGALVMPPALVLALGARLVF